MSRLKVQVFNSMYIEVTGHSQDSRDDRFLRRRRGLESVLGPNEVIVHGRPGKSTGGDSTRGKGKSG